MKDWKPGDSAQVSDRLHPRFGEVGVVERLGETGGLWVRHQDGVLIYHPWGYDIVRRG